MLYQTYKGIDYVEGFSAILNTAARWSYVYLKINVIWLIEWDPSLIILELQNKEIINFTALSSLIPDFRGREPLEVDNDNEYDEGSENYQYNLIFDACDA